MHCGLRDQISDPRLEALPEMLSSLMGPNIMQSNVNPLEDILPGLIPQNSSTRVVIMGRPPQAETYVSPDGRTIVRKMRSSNMAFMDGMGGPLMRHQMSPALGDHFPMHNPMQAILSMLYAKGQEHELGTDLEDVIEPKAREVAGDAVIDEMLNFIKSVKAGSEEFILSDEGKKVVVTVEDYSKAAQLNAHGLSEETQETIEHTSPDATNPDSDEDQALLDALKDSKQAKRADFDILNAVRGKGSMFAQLELEHLKRHNQVQTSLPKLAQILEPLAVEPDIKQFIQLLKYSMRTDGYLTLAHKEAQDALLAKLSDIFKNLEGDSPVDESFLKELVFNTDVPSSEAEVIHLKGYPIDLEKLYGMSYTDAQKALTATIADMIFEEDHSKVSLSKFKDFVGTLLSEDKDAIETEEVSDRIVTPILSAFAPTKDSAPEEVKEGSLSEALLLAFTPEDSLLKKAGIDLLGLL